MSASEFTIHNIITILLSTKSCVLTSYERSQHTNFESVKFKTYLRPSSLVQLRLVLQVVKRDNGAQA